MEARVKGFERYAAPGGLAEAVQLLADGDATLLGGGTDLMPLVQSGTQSFGGLLLNLRRIPEMHGVSRTNGRIRIGALCTVTEILRNPLLRESASILPEVADCFASGQVRHTATVGGNLCNASPAGDLIIPLLLLDAEIELASWVGGKVTVRRMALRDFFVGPGATQVLPTELLTAIEFAVPGTGFVAGFRKFGVRPAMDIAVVSVGIAGMREDHALRDTRVAFGAVAPTPLRGGRTEAAIEGEALTPEIISKAARSAREEVSPISDVRASAWYRKELVSVLTGRLLRDVGQ
jgi:CO/xanthine dehydrogenase FAD-binding subunit